MFDEILRDTCLSLTEKEKQFVKDAIKEGKVFLEQVGQAIEAEESCLPITMHGLLLATFSISLSGARAKTSAQKKLVGDVLKKFRDCALYLNPSQAPGEPEAPATAKGRGAAKNEDCASIYQLHIFLEDIEPKIWRRIQVPSGFSLAELHLAIQAAMGWDNYHLYEFKVGRDRYSFPDDDYGDDLGDSALHTLSDIAPNRGKKFTYTYDFGDNWLHRVKVEKILPPEDGATYPRCIDGARACPHEDCGGPPGYMQYVEAIIDPKHPEHEEFLAWSGAYDPERFSLVEANRALKGYFKTAKKKRKK